MVFQAEKIDGDGFIYIVGRLSRFSKIGGEMVPHVQIEETLHRILGFDDMLLAVMSVRIKRRKTRSVASS